MFINRKKLIIGGMAALALLALLFNDSLRATFTRQKAIRAARAELARLTEQAEALKTTLSDIEKDPRATERLVRKELGYLRPGEREVRFVTHRNGDTD